MIAALMSAASSAQVKVSHASVNPEMSRLFEELTQDTLFRRFAVFEMSADAEVFVEVDIALAGLPDKKTLIFARDVDECRKIFKSHKLIYAGICSTSSLPCLIVSSPFSSAM